MQLSVIIPTHNRFSSVLNLVDSIFRQNFPKNEFEVFLITNLPNIRLPSELKKHFGHYSNWKFYCSGRIGVNCARNYGLDKAHGDYLLFLDDDCYLQDSNYFQRLIQHMQENPQAAAIGGPYLSPITANPRDQVYHKVTEDWLNRSVIDPLTGQTSQLLGGNVCYRRSIFKTGLRFNEDYILCGADSEFHSRLVKHGHKLWLSQDLAIQHQPQLNIRQFLKKSFLFGRKSHFDELTNNKPPLLWRRDFSDRKAKDIAELIYLQIYRYAFDRGRIWAFEEKKNRTTLSRWFHFIFDNLLIDSGLVYKKIQETIETYKYLRGNKKEISGPSLFQFQLQKNPIEECRYCAVFNCHAEHVEHIDSQLQKCLEQGQNTFVLPHDFLEKDFAFSFLEATRSKNLTPILRLPTPLAENLKQQALLLSFSGCQFEFVIDQHNQSLQFLDEFDKAHAKYTLNTSAQPKINPLIGKYVSFTNSSVP